MYEDILQRMRQCVRQYNLIIPFHARMEMQDDGIGQYDIEHVILTGRIVERQRDHVSAEFKYRIKGTTYNSRRPMEVVAKLIYGNKTLVITVYLL